MTHAFLRRIGGIAVAGAVAAAVLVPLTTGAGGAGPSPSPSPVPEGCRLRSPQPEAPLKLSVVGVRDLVKSVAMEKEVFDCYDQHSTLSQIKDVETFIEVVRHGRSAPKPSVATSTKSVEIATCVKDLQNGRVSCGTSAVPLGVTETPLSKCSTTSGTYPFAPVEQPSHPVEMAGATFDKDLVATVKVEKEVFDCGGRVADLYVLATRVESLRGASFAPVANQFDGVVCFKDVVKGIVAECRLFQP